MNHEIRGGLKRGSEKSCVTVNRAPEAAPDAGTSSPKEGAANEILNQIVSLPRGSGNFAN